jgi:hypothetical protein
MTYSRPEPESAWARQCPEAFPREWLAGSPTIPEGFTRLATGKEADLIRGRISEDAFLGRRPATAPKKRKGKKAVHPVVKKVKGYRIFFEELEAREPRLSPLAVAVWCWLWTCGSGGLCPTSERRLEKRFGSTRKTIRSRLRELEAAGYLELRSRGEKGRTSTVYRVRFRPVERGRDDPSTGGETTP